MKGRTQAVEKVIPAHKSVGEKTEANVTRRGLTTERSGADGEVHIRGI